MRFNQVSCDICGWKSETPLSDDELRKFIKGTDNLCQDCKKNNKKSKFRVRSFTVTSRSHRKG